MPHLDYSSSRDRRPNPDYRLQRRVLSYHGTLLVAKFSCRPPWFSTLIRKLVRVPQVFQTRVQELVLTREMRVPSGYWVTGSLGHWACSCKKTRAPLYHRANQPWSAENNSPQPAQPSTHGPVVAQSAAATGQVADEKVGTVVPGQCACIRRDRTEVLLVGFRLCYCASAVC